MRWDCGQTVKYERGAREGLSPGRVGDRRDPIGSQAARRSKACCRGVRRALRVSEACKEIIDFSFFLPVVRQCVMPRPCEASPPLTAPGSLKSLRLSETHFQARAECFCCFEECSWI